MLRRAPTSITLTSEDITAYDDSRAARLAYAAQQAAAAAAAHAQNQPYPYQQPHSSRHPSHALDETFHTPNRNSFTPTGGRTGSRQQAGTIDPNDELKPLPGDKARVGRPVVGAGAGVGDGRTREERIVGAGTGMGR